MAKAGLLAAIVGMLAAVPIAAGAPSDTQKLYVSFLVTQAFSVTLPDGTPVGTSSAPGTTIAPGTYELIFDNSNNVKNMDFQLTGPNVSLQEDMGGGEESSAGDYVTFLPSSQYSFHDGNNVASPSFYLQTITSTVQMDDFVSGIFKTFFFGALIAWVGCFAGLRTTGGTVGVGSATTRAVVGASIGILIVDFFLTQLWVLL